MNPTNPEFPDRIVVGANGAYWRDFGDSYSMCPVSEDNDPVVVVATYVRSMTPTPDPLRETAFPRTAGWWQLADAASALWWQPNPLAGANAMQSATQAVRDAILDIEREAVQLAPWYPLASAFSDTRCADCVHGLHPMNICADIVGVAADGGPDYCPCAVAPIAALAQPAPALDPLRDEDVARLFHDAYERLAPSFGYQTRKASAVPWSDVPEPNRLLMVAVVSEVRAALAQPAPALDVAPTPTPLRAALDFAAETTHHHYEDSDNQSGHIAKDWHKCDEWPCSWLTQPAPALDVARLAQAIHNWHNPGGRCSSGTSNGGCHSDAASIAREYAALAEPQP